MSALWTTWDKPAGIPVFPPNDGTPGPSVLADLLSAEQWRAEVAWPAGFAGGLCHRLDTATSGALLVAGDLPSLEEARRQFTGGLLRKQYLLLAARDVAWDEHRCERPIAHDPRRRARMVVQRGTATPHRGRWYPATTTFRRVSGRLFLAEMRSGVMHQIRVHAAFLGIPLAGDRLYGGSPGELRLHHLGLRGEGGLATTPVAEPAWVTEARAPTTRS